MCDLDSYNRVLFLELLLYIFQPYPLPGLTTIILTFGYLTNIIYNKKCYNIVLILTCIDTVIHTLSAIITVFDQNYLFTQYVILGNRNDLIVIIAAMGILFKITINTILIILTHRSVNNFPDPPPYS